MPAVSRLETNQALDDIGRESGPSRGVHSPIDPVALRTSSKPEHATRLDTYRERVMRAPSDNGFEDVRCQVRLRQRVDGHVGDKLRTDYRR